MWTKAVQAHKRKDCKILHVAAACICCGSQSKKEATYPVCRIQDVRLVAVTLFKSTMTFGIGIKLRL